MNLAVETETIIKTVGVTTGNIAPPAMIATQIACGIDYTAPQVIIPIALSFIVSTLTIVWLSIQIYKTLK